MPNIRVPTGSGVNRVSVPGATLSSSRGIDNLIAALPVIHREAAKAGARSASNAIDEVYEEEGPGWSPNAPSTLERKGADRPILVGRRHNGAPNRDARLTETLQVNPLGAEVGHGWDDSQHPDAGPGKSRAYVQAVQEFGAGVPRREVLGPVLESGSADDVGAAIAAAWNLGVETVLSGRGRLRRVGPPGESEIARRAGEVIG